MEQFDPIDVDFIINNNEVKASSEKVKQDLKSIGQTAEETAAKVDSQLKGAFARPDNANAVKALNNDLKEQGNIITKNKPAYNGLGNAINQISREASAFTVSAQTGFLAISNNIPILADEIQRIKDKNAELTASGQKGVPVWKQLVSGLYSWQTAMSVGITLLTIYGKEFVTWVGALFKGKEAIDELKASQKALNDTFNSGSYQKVIKDVLELSSYIKLAKQGIIDKDVALKKYNETLGEASGKVNSLADAEQGVIDKAPAYVKAMLYKTAAAQASGEAAKQLAESAKKEQELNDKIVEAQKAYNESLKAPSNQAAQAGGVFTNTGATQNANRQNLFKNDLDELLKEREKLNTASINVITKLNEEAAKIAKAAGLDIFGDDEKKKTAKVVSDYQSLLDKLSDLDKEYSRKSFTKDEEELQALRDKFDKIRTLVERFNADPKNKAQIIDLTNLDKLQVKAEASLTYRQTTEKLKDELAEQQKLFTEFEDYKTKFGIEAAKKEFEGRIGAATTYYDFLKQKQQENEASYTAVKDGTAIGGEIERVQLLDEALKKEQTKIDAHFRDLLAKYQSFGQRRKVLEEQYKADLAALSGTDAIERRSAEFKNAMDGLAQEELESTDTYKRLIMGVETLSKEAAQNVINETRRMVEALLSAGNISQLAADGILERLNEAQKKLDVKSSTASQLRELSASFLNLGGSLDSYNQNLAKLLTNAGELLGVTSNALETIGDSAATGLEKTTSVIGLFITGYAKLKELTEFLNKDKRLENQISINKTVLEQINIEAAINKLYNERNELIRESSILLESLYKDDYNSALRIGTESLELFEKSLNALKSGALITGTGKTSGFFGIGAKDKDFNFNINSVLDYILGSGKLPGSFNDATKNDAFLDAVKSVKGVLESMGKTINDVANFSSEEWLDFLTIVEASGRLTEETTKQLFAAAKSSLEEYQKALEDMRSIISDFAGALGDDLQNALVSAFKTGEDAATQFKKSVSSVLQDLFLNELINSSFKTYFDKLQAEMEGSFGAGGDQSWIDDIKRFSENISPQFQAALDAMEAFNNELKAQGFTGFEGEDTAKKQGLTGAIRREITEETGSELLGLFRGQYDVTKRALEAAEAYYEKEQQYYDNFLTLLAINTAIRDNTGATVLELQKAIVELKIIAENTDKIYLNDISS